MRNKVLKFAVNNVRLDLHSQLLQFEIPHEKFDNQKFRPMTIFLTRVLRTSKFVKMHKQSKGTLSKDGTI